MNRQLVLTVFAAVVLSISFAESASAVCAVCNNSPLCRSYCYDWNKPYRHTAYGQPVALVVPPTATMQTNWGWGVGSSRLERLDHQFGRNFPGGGPFGGPYRPTPIWPSDTTQFGVYNVRGPW